MEIKVLETKLQTILEDDSLEITKENAVEKIEEILVYYIEKLARFNDSIGAIQRLNETYSSDFKEVETSRLFDILTDTWICLCENENISDKEKVLNIIIEIFYNQDLYDLINNSIPAIKKLVNKLNDDNCIFKLEDIINWIKDGLDGVGIENIENLTVFEYLDNDFEDFNNLYVPEEKVKIVVNKEGVEDERRGGN